MLKQAILLVVLSIAAVLLIHQVHAVLGFVSDGYHFFAVKLSHIFAGGHIARVIREVIALLIVPAVVGLIVAAVYWLIKRKLNPALMLVVWIVWVILVTLIAMR